MKNFFILLLTLCLIPLFSENIEKEALIFERYESSVVYIYQSLYFDSKHVSKPEVFNRIEEKYEIKILDKHFSLASGTGFFITKDGHLITNHHVVDASKLNELKDNIYKVMLDEFFSKIPYSVISDSEYDLLKSDLRTLLNKALFEYRILYNNDEEFTAKLLKSDKDLDLALLKVDDKSFTPAPLGDSELLKVGNFIMAIGYPVPSSLFHAVKDFKSTMTSGRVSAIRSDTWGIQHTSAISPGNSGGPLFNRDGEVIGINVGAVTTGNDLYFSIPTSKLIKWIEGSKYSSVITKNREQAHGLGQQYAVNDEGYMEIGESIFVNMPEDHTIFINGKLKGNCPLLLESLKPGKMVLRVESATGYSEQKMLVKGDISDIVTYEPIMHSYNGKLFVSAGQKGVNIYLNGKKVGQAPMVLNKVKVGSHKLRFQLDGYFDEEETVTIKKDKTSKIDVNLSKGYKLIFSPELPKGTTITVEGDSKTETFKEGETVLLRKGEWKVTAVNESFEEAEFEFTVKDDDITLDFEPELYTAELTLSQLRESSKVYIDGEDYTDKIENSKVELVIGTYKIKVVTEGYDDFEDRITLKREEGTEVTVAYNEVRKEIAPHLKYKRAGIGLTVVGALSFASSVGFIAGGAITFIDPFDVYQVKAPDSFSYSSSSSSTTTDSRKYAIGGALIGTGVVLSITGLVLTFVGPMLTMISRRMEYANKSHVQTYSMMFDMNGGPRLYFSCKF